MNVTIDCNEPIMNARATHNLDVLSNRARGQRFMVNKEGRLAPLTSLSDKIYYFFFKAKVQGAVKKVITETVQLIVPKSPDIDLKKLFFKTLRPLSENVYDRARISNAVIKAIGPASANRAKEGQTPLQELAERVNEVKFAIKLGVDFEPVSEGHNGTYFGRNYLGTRLVVFKPSDEESTSARSPKLVSKLKGILFKVFPFLKTHSNIKRDCAYLNEIGASRVNEYLGFDLVPVTSLETFKSQKFVGSLEKKGSCQMYVENTKMMQEAIGLPDFTPFFSLRRCVQKLWLALFGKSVPQLFSPFQLEKLAIIEFLTGNQDGHLNNLMVQKTGKKFQKLVAIDYGLSFPAWHPDRFIAPINQYHWKYLPGRDQSFTIPFDELKLDDPENLFQILEQEMTDEDSSGFDENQKETMRERIEILKAVITQRKPLAYLGNIQTKDDFIRVQEELKNPSANVSV
jgi:hypothetical protein